mmetsp:Transcript_66449/g.150035  ORF Transcript_66449/g.150035 Transcript_66449/m.150035 type:complete len:234 (-) Transcript_66449:104-805(-)
MKPLGHVKKSAKAGQHHGRLVVVVARRHVLGGAVFVQQLGHLEEAPLAGAVHGGLPVLVPRAQPLVQLLLLGANLAKPLNDFEVAALARHVHGRPQESGLRAHVNGGPDLAEPLGHLQMAFLASLVHGCLPGKRFVGKGLESRAAAAAPPFQDLNIHARSLFPTLIGRGPARLRPSPRRRATEPRGDGRRRSRNASAVSRSCPAHESRLRRHGQRDNGTRRALRQRWPRGSRC